MRFQKTLFIILLIVFPFSIVSAQDTTVNYVLSSVNCNSGFYKPNLPNTINGFRLLGKRNKEQIQPASDYTGDPKTHTSAIFWYDGMLLDVVFRNKKPYGYFLESATFSHSRWNQYTPIKVGTPIQPFLSKNKLSSVPPETTLVHICSSTEEEGAPDCIDLSIKEGVIMEIKYECYTG
jgi:hypothetical protein